MHFPRPRAYALPLNAKNAIEAGEKASSLNHHVISPE